MKKRTLKLLGFWISLLAILLFALSIIYKQEVISFLIKKEGGYFLTILFILSFFMEFIPQYLSAHLLIINTALLEISLVYSTITIIAGTLLGNILGFEIGKKSSALEFQKEELKKVETYISRYGKFFMAIAAVSPLPYFPMIFGFLKIKRTDFLIFGVIPRIIGLVSLSLIIGTGIF